MHALPRPGFQHAAARAVILLAVIVAGPARTAPVQTDDSAYTRYELLVPASHKFRIICDITATSAGAMAYCNTIRTGSIATDPRETDSTQKWRQFRGARQSAGVNPGR
ncbi:hypothetical protein [Sandarakinorhabdus limnophila]|uniref:hypothetical protein n=1 Tax=Sandarakinorhabdus limnophila TaxID=210512 RepID=UPI0012EC9BE5|nr:hypothetical protein [Sandarakinorhabdus limnophila]